MSKKENRKKACLEASARLRRRLDAMERIPLSYTPGVGGCLVDYTRRFDA